MRPKKPMSKKEIISSLKNLERTTEKLKEESIEIVEVDQEILKFRDMSDEDISLLTSKQKEKLIFKLLRALIK